MFGCAVNGSLECICLAESICRELIFCCRMTRELEPDLKQTYASWRLSVKGKQPPIDSSQFALIWLNAPIPIPTFSLLNF